MAIKRKFLRVNEKGEPVKDEKGNLIFEELDYIPTFKMVKVNEKGEPVKDEKGNLIFEEPKKEKATEKNKNEANETAEEVKKILENNNKPTSDKALNENKSGIDSEEKIKKLEEAVNLLKKQLNVEKPIPKNEGNSFSSGPEQHSSLGIDLTSFKIN